MKLREWVFRNKGFKLEEIDSPDELKEGELLIKPLMVGICGSDLFAIEVADEKTELHLGHEWVGEVIQSSSKKFKVGDNVTSAAFLGCGECPTCKQGETNLCAKGSVFGGTEIGALREKVILQEENLVLVSGLSKEASVLIEVAAVSFEAISQIKRLGFKKEQKLLIFGAGPVGLFCALQAKRENYDYQLLEVDKYRVEFAASLGLNVEYTPIKLMDADQSGAFPYIIDCSGDGNQKQGFWKFANFFSAVGVNILIVGKYINSPNINSNQFAVRNATIKWMKGMPQNIISNCYEYWKKDIEDISKKMITQKYSFKDVSKAFEIALKRDKTIKVVISLEEDL